jgi:ubiquinone/menaquinone biosynthesis C-methylase UbiE
MAGKKSIARQPSLFKREIPQMPEGYYSSGPNPNLRRFVEEHATPYDPASDDYDVPPFDQPITTTKATAIYNMHTYWSKKPHDAIRQYIRHYTQPGDVVLDPMCGSGGTALAALMEGRAAIAIDLSPAATFITKNYCTPVDVDELQRAFDELQAQVAPEMDWLYETRCDRCDGRATTGYTVYSYVFQCSRCLEKVPLFDCVDAVGQTAKGKPKKIKACPHCYAKGQVEEISATRNERFDPVPVLVSYLCEEGCKPKRGERRHNDPNPKKRAFFEKHDLGKLREIEAKQIPYRYPPHRMMNIKSDTDPWGDKWRAGTSSFRTVAELFTKRNLWALAILLDTIRQLDNDALSFAFQGNVLSASIMQQYRQAGGGFAKGTYYVPQIFIEREQWGCLGRKVADVIKGKTVVSEKLTSTELCISTQSAADISDILSSTVDYIFTDPPYAGKVQYGELNFVWEAWLGFDTHWHDEEIIINKTRGKTDADWTHMMRQAMGECYRVLKPGRWLSLCYHDTSEGTWQLIQDLMTEIGFIPESSEAALYIDTAQKSFNQLMADKVTRRDLVINFRKPRPGELIAQLTLFGDEDAATFAEKARAILREALQAHPGSPADRLYDELVSRMVRKGEFERHNFEGLLRDVAEEVQGRWYLLETADQVDEAESAKEATAAARLEAFMEAYLEERPEEPGVHYSDLFEQYLPVSDKPRRLLIDWLPEYFFKTAEGTWRPPANEEERAQKAALRASGALRRIKRFARALQEGVPPHERDRPANVATAADWVRQCRRAGLYELGRVLYERGGFGFEELGEEGLMEVEEDYQICVRRSQ